MSEEYEYEMEVFLDPDAPSDSNGVAAPENAPALRRLQNLGYGTGEPLSHQVRSFQRDLGLTETGVLDDIADKLNQHHDACNPPLRLTGDAA